MQLTTQQFVNADKSSNKPPTALEVVVFQEKQMWVEVTVTTVLFFWELTT